MSQNNYFHCIAKTLKRSFLSLRRWLFFSAEAIPEDVEITNRNFEDRSEAESDDDMKRKIQDSELELEEDLKRLRIQDSPGETELSEVVEKKARNFQDSDEETKEEMKCSELEESICELRSYQRRMVASILEENTIILLPTGAGKTLIAAECAKLLDGKTLFLVPTCILVEQQAAAIRNWTGLRVAEYMSGRSRAVLQAFDILVSTPESFRRAQLDPMLSFLSWENFKLVVFDEAHHVLKEHPYSHLAKALKDSTAKPRVVGLSASLTYEVKPERIEAQVQQLCNDLRIRGIATATDAELKESGYHATRIPVNVRLPTLEQSMNFLPMAERRPHDMRRQFFERINSGTATAFASALMSVIRTLEEVCISIHSTFKSPLMDKSLTDWGVYALSLSVSSDCPFCKELAKWYEALRLLVVSFEDAEDTATMLLRMHGLDADPGDVLWPPTAAEARENFFNTVITTSFPRFEHFKDCLKYELDRIEDFRCIVFVEQRITTHILKYIISTDPELSELIRSTCIYATDSTASASLKALTKRDVATRIGAFASGHANMLLATVMAEEGMDIPEANCVIRFDAMVHSVSMVQGRGRARHAKSSMIVLSERSDRSVSKLTEVEKLQRRIVSDFRPDAIHNALPTTPKDIQVEARSLLSKDPSLAGLNELCQKTKVSFEEHFTEKSLSGWPNGWHCKLVYVFKQRQFFGEATGHSKKEAKASAAVHLMQALKLDKGEACPTS